MRLSWNEVKARAARFAAEHAGSTYEKGETQTFYNEFFEVFGVARKRIAVFEKQVSKLDNSKGFIDLFWPGQLIVEQKSAGKSLAKAQLQALDYCSSLKPAEHPRYLLVSDFQHFELYDLQEREEWKFTLSDFPRHVEAFGFILGRQKRTYLDQPDVNIKASELMGAVHDALDESGYRGHALERFLVRLLFCLFADDTGIFEPRGIFETWLRERSSEDGYGLGAQMTELFQVLDTPEDHRSSTLDDDLAQFPYINGDLFKEPLRIPAFNSEMRMALIDASEFKWEAVSPAIFGSLFQSVMNKDERRRLGAHYTSEKNILKAISPLFLDDLQAELEQIRALKRGKAKELNAFIERLAKVRVFDPACGCGNFLIIAYRELRALELAALRALNGTGQLELDATAVSRVDVDQFYGLESEEFPARIAEVALWMMDHIMNTRLGLEFGQVFTRIPLKKSPHIRHGNALAINWSTVIPAADCDYIVGNPPFIGHQWRSKAQQADMANVWGTDGQVNRLDYVTCWFKRAVEYAQANRNIRIAFVATNSITQGEQTSILWPPIFSTGAIINFAHRTFQWNSEARGKAAVHCVIIGLTLKPPATVSIYDYESVRGEPHVSQVSGINGYLIDGALISIPARTQAPPGFPQMFKGSQPTDGARLKDARGKYVTTSNLILDAGERAKLLVDAPQARKWLRPFVGGDELLSGDWRWCLWLKDANPAELRANPQIVERLNRVRNGRLKSSTASVREFAKYPSLFTQDRQPDVSYLALPRVSSERRLYIPVVKLPANVIAHEKLIIVPGGEDWLFALLMSAMHMDWVRAVAGRLESRYSYSPAVYNSFPWPDLPILVKQKLVASAESIIEARQRFEDSQLDVLYDPDTMPPALRKAHVANDRLVDGLYRKQLFRTERERVEYLFDLFEKRAVPLAPAAKAKGRSKRATSH